MLRSIELFSGTGGLALGLHQAGFSPAALLEWDKNSCDNIKANISKGFKVFVNIIQVIYWAVMKIPLYIFVGQM